MVHTISELVAKVAKGIQEDFNQESCWVMIRTTLPNHEYDIPRWHVDGGYGGPNYEGKTYKLVFTVKGAPTRFAETIDKQKFNQLITQDPNGENMQTRKELETIVEENKPISQDQATIYLVDDKNAKVHSEPPINESRIFMSVVPGSVEQIEKFKKRYEE